VFLKEEVMVRTLLTMLIAATLVFPLATCPTLAATLTVHDASAHPGESVTVSVLIDDATDLLSADISLAYDPNVLQVMSVKTTGLTSGFTITHAVTWRRISISLAGAAALAGGSGSPVDVEFAVFDDADPGQTEISISEATTYGSNHQASTPTLPANPATLTVLSTGSGDGGAGGGGGGAG
jgi:hypothetical protein